MISRKPSKVCIAIDTELSLVKTPISAISDDGADSRASRRPVVSVSRGRAMALRVSPEHQCEGQSAFHFLTTDRRGGSLIEDEDRPAMIAVNRTWSSSIAAERVDRHVGH